MKNQWARPSFAAALLAAAMCFLATANQQAQILGFGGLGAGASHATVVHSTGRMRRNGKAGGQPHSPPQGAGLVATLTAGQQVYTNYPSTVWCPLCVSDPPPCLLPCYAMEQCAVAQFTFTVENDFHLPRTFYFSSGQQTELQLSDETGTVVAAWSDGRLFTQELTSFTLGPGQRKVFTLDLELKDRQGVPLDGSYLACAFLTAAGPPPSVQATCRFIVTPAP